MGNWVDQLTGGIQQVTEVVETVGDFADAVSGTIGGSSQPTYSNPVYAQTAAKIQAKNNANQALTEIEIKNIEQLRGMGFAFSYPMEYTGYSGQTNNSGIMQAGLFDQAVDAVVDAATGAAAGAAATAAGGITSLVPWWKGPGGKLQMPWNDPQVAQYLKQFALDDSYLKTYYRAPRGYVIVHDAAGRPYAVLRQIARQFGLWKPAARPPISATDWKHYKRNKATEKKLIKIARPALRARARPSAAQPRRK